MAKENKANTDGIGKALAERQEPKSGGRGLTLAKLLNTETISNRFHEVLGRKSAAFMSSILSACATNPKLSACDPMSVISAAMIAATLDLPINPNLGQAHIVPYKDKATFQIGWKGLVQLAQRSGQYRTMNASVVYEGQLIKSNPFTGEFDFDAEAKKSDKIVGYLFYFKLLNGFEKYVYLTRDGAEAHGKKFSKSYGYDTSAWKTNFEAMALNTCVKSGLSKWGPLSTEMQKAMEFDQAAVTEDDKPDYIDAKTDGGKEVDGEIQEGPSIPTEELNKIADEVNAKNAKEAIPTLYNVGEDQE